MFPHLHLFQYGETHWEIWLDTPGGQHDGICLASGTNLEEVRVEAERVLMNARRVIFRIPVEEAIKEPHAPSNR